MPKTRTILVCTPHSLTAAGISGILEGRGYRVPSVTREADSLRDAVQSENPDIVLIDSSLLEAALPAIHELSSRTVVAILVGPDRSLVLREAMAAGARGFLSVDLEPAQFLESISLLAEGSVVISADTGRLIADAGRTGDAFGRPVVDLTEREREIAVLVARGATNSEIGDALSVSEHSVKVGLNQILAKLGLRNRQQIAVYAARQGLLEDVPLGEQAPHASDRGLRETS